MFRPSQGPFCGPKTTENRGHGGVSGFCLIFNRDGAPVDGDIVQSMMSRLEHRGPDGRRTVMLGHIGLGHQHFWTTPEDVGERQPLSGTDGRAHVLFDGRLDNRSELFSELHIPGAEGRQLSDAALVLRAYERWGGSCAEHLLGPFAFVIYDAMGESVLCARDPLGDRTLFYYVNDTMCVVASEEYAVLAHPQLSSDLDGSTIALYLALLEPSDGATFFEDVRELLPAHAMAITQHTSTRIRYWQPDPGARVRCDSDAEYAELFLDVLGKAVRCRMRSTTPPVVLMSGGLDSTSVAAIAARELARATPASRLRTLSWVFDELPGADERRWIEAMVEHLDLDARLIPAQEHWPLRDVESSPRNPNRPEQNPYYLLDGLAYRAAREVRSRVVLTGLGADDLYGDAQLWLAELLAEGQIGTALERMAIRIRRYGVVRALTGRAVRGVAGRVLDRVPGGRIVWPRGERPRPVWLTAKAVDALPPTISWPARVSVAGRPWQRHAVLGIHKARLISSSIWHANCHGVDRRHPYRDRRVVEFFLAIPAYQLYNGLDGKLIVRNAMVGALPVSVRERTVSTSLLLLFVRGIAERYQLVEAMLASRGAAWREFVEPSWLRRVVLERRGDTIDALEERGLSVLWRCLGLDRWVPGAAAARPQSLCVSEEYPWRAHPS